MEFLKKIIAAFILLQLFAHVQEIKPCNKTTRAWHMLICVCHVESYLFTYLPTYLLYLSQTEMLY